MNGLKHVVLVLVLVSLDAGQALAAPLTDLLKASPVLDVQISPDGKHLAILRREQKDTLYVIGRADHSIVAGVSSSPGQRFHQFHWANGNRLLIEPAVELEGFEQPLPTGALLGFSIDGRQNGYLRRTTGAGGAQIFALVAVLPGDPDHVLVARYRFEAAGTPPGTYARVAGSVGLTERLIAVAQQGDGHEVLSCDSGCTPDREAPPELLRLNLYSGEANAVVTAPSLQGEFIANADGSRVIFTGIDSGRVSLYESRGSERWEEISYFTRYEELGATPIGFAGDGAILALDNLVDTLGISRIDPNGTVSPVFRDKVADVESLVFGRDGSLLAAGFLAGFPSWYYHEAEGVFARTHRALRAAYPDSDVAVTSFTSDGSEAVVRVYSDRNPGDYYLVNLQTREAEDLLRRVDWLQDEELAASVPVQIRTRDGFVLHGYLTQPVGGSAPAPLVVTTQPHPFSDRFRWEYDPRAQLFAAAGIAVLQINARGAPGYGLRYTTGSEAELDDWTDRDIVDAVKWAGTQEIVDRDRVCLFGSGRGGYTALLTALRNPGAFRCVVAADARFRPEEAAVRPLGFRPFAVALLSSRDIDRPPWADDLLARADRLETPTLLVDAQAREDVGQFAARAGAGTVRQLSGITAITGLHPVGDLVATYEQILAFLRGHFAAPEVGELPAAPLHALLQSEERARLQQVLDRIQADIARATRVRDPKSLPTGFDSRSADPEERVRRAIRALQARDREVRAILPEPYWPAYEAFRDSYSAGMQVAIRTGREIEPYRLAGDRQQ